jgi:hypothetical protein
MKKTIQRSLLLVAAAAFTLLGIHRFSEYNTNRSLELQNIRLSRGIDAGDNLADHENAVRCYRDLKPMIPEVHLRILQRQWLIALERLEEIRIAQSNTLLKKDVPLLYRQLAEHLREMENRCDLVLADTEALRGDIAWRICNVRALVKIVSSFLVLETEKNWKKVRGKLKEATSDLKSAIDIVDKTASSNLEKNICRWNLEILGQQQPGKKMKLAESDAEHHLVLRDNLEAIIPEKGGYAPGEAMGGAMKK